MAYKSSPHKKTFLCFFMWLGKYLNIRIIPSRIIFTGPICVEQYLSFLCTQVDNKTWSMNIFLLLYCSFCINNISNPTTDLAWSSFLVVTNFISQVKMKIFDQILLLLVGVSYYSTTVVVSFWCQRPCSWQLRKLLSSGCV